MLYRKIENNIKIELEEDQFRFKKSRATREAILALKLIMEGKYMKKKKILITTFVNIEKAFDNVIWKKIFDILRNLRIRFNERRTIFKPI